MSGGHPHARRESGETDGGFDWFAVLDVAVWAAVAVIAVVGIEWLIGHVIRESLASGAGKYLKKQSQQEKPAT